MGRRIIPQGWPCCCPESSSSNSSSSGSSRSGGGPCDPGAFNALDLDIVYTGSFFLTVSAPGFPFDGVVVELTYQGPPAPPPPIGGPVVWSGTALGCEVDLVLATFTSEFDSTVYCAVWEIGFINCCPQTITGQADVSPSRITSSTTMAFSNWVSNGCGITSATLTP